MNARHIAAASLFGVVLVLSGCSAPPAPASPTSTSPTSTSPGDDAFAAAEASYRAYVDALNQVDLSDPETFEPVFALTTGELHTNDREGLTKYQADKVTVSGTSRVTRLERSSVDTSSGAVTFAVCLDVSSVQLRDSAGLSMVDPDRVAVQSLEVTAIESPQGSMSYKISSIAGRDGEPTCE